ncbi:MAG: YciI family protein [bacterium]
MNEFVFLYRGHDSDGSMPTPEQMQAQMSRWQDWFAKLTAEGQLKDWGAPLQSSGKKVAVGGIITDGPYTEGKELIGGFSIIKANDLAHAAEIAKGCPCFETGGNVEIRPVQPM